MASSIAVMLPAGTIAVEAMVHTRFSPTVVFPRVGTLIGRMVAAFRIGTTTLAGLSLKTTGVILIVRQNRRAAIIRSTLSRQESGYVRKPGGFGPEPNGRPWSTPIAYERRSNRKDCGQ